MIIIYTPATGEEPQRFDSRLRVSETIQAARTTGREWPDIRSSLDVDRESMRVVAWVVQKRHRPELRYADFDPFEDELAVKLDSSEVTRFAQASANLAWLDPEATSESVAAALRGIPLVADDVEHAETLVAQLAATRPKDRSPQATRTTDPSETPKS